MTDEMDKKPVISCFLSMKTRDIVMRMETAMNKIERHIRINFTNKSAGSLRLTPMARQTEQMRKMEKMMSSSPLN